MNYKSRSHRFGKRKKLRFKGLLRVTILLALVAFVLFTYRTVNLVTVLQGRDGYFQKNIDSRENYLIAFEGEQLNTAFIISVDKQGSAYFIDIPNNSRVDTNTQKIMLTELYEQSGSEGLLTAVHSIFNGKMDIDNYLIIKEAGMVQLINKLGGLNLNLETDYDLPSIILYKGDYNRQTDSVLKFFSSVERNERTSYMERQVITLQSMFNQYLKFGKSITLVSGISSLDGSLETNMTVRELAWFRNMLDDVQSRESHSLTVPGMTEDIAEKELWIINNARVNSTLQDISENRPIIGKDGISVEVLNGNGASGAADMYSNKIKTLGYTSNIETGNADSYNYQVTTISFPEKYRHLAEEIAKELDVSASAEYIVINQEQITIILGKDLR